MFTWLKTSRGPAPESAVTGATGFVKMIRIWASVWALPVGEMEPIQGGSDGCGNAATGVSCFKFGPGPPHEAMAAAVRIAQGRPKKRNDHLLERARRVPSVVHSVQRP